MVRLFDAAIDHSWTNSAHESLPVSDTLRILLDVEVGPNAHKTVINLERNYLRC